MQILPYKTKVVEPGDDLYALIENSIDKIDEKSVLCISSKIVALCQGDVRPMSYDKNRLMIEECEKYIPSDKNPHSSIVTITGYKLAAASGIDESNVHGGYVLLPSHIKETTQQIYEWLRAKYSLKEVGVLIVDSRSSPLNIGTIGQCIAFAGFEPLKDYRGLKDIFDHEIHSSRLSVINCLASSTVLVMGEGSEQTPLAVATDIGGVNFTENKYNGVALDYEIEDDLYITLLANENWQAGGRGYLARQ